MLFAEDDGADAVVVGAEDCLLLSGGIDTGTVSRRVRVMDARTYRRTLQSKQAL